MLEFYKTAEKERSLIFAKVFLWMFSGVFISFLVGAFLKFSGLLMVILKYQAACLGLLIGNIAIAFLFYYCLKKFSASIATALFFIYSALTGFSIAQAFEMFTGMSVISALCGTSGMFILLAVYGFTTKRDVSKWSNILSAALISSIVFSLLNVFLFKSNMLETVINAACIIIFSFFTIYDVSIMKKQLINISDSETMKKAQIYFAFTIYLDFILLFLNLLEMFGKRDD